MDLRFPHRHVNEILNYLGGKLEEADFPRQSPAWEIASWATEAGKKVIMLIPCDNEPDKDTQTGKVARANRADGKASVTCSHSKY